TIALRLCFFQAEAGIRDGHVTGVQTCALPISKLWSAVTCRQSKAASSGPANQGRTSLSRLTATSRLPKARTSPRTPKCGRRGFQIGRASCRERVEISEVVVSLEKKDNRD